MILERTAIDGPLIVCPAKHGDDRGFFSETFSQATLLEAGVDENWVQDNHSFSQAKGVVRGLHFQKRPNAQAKILRVTRGAIFDVAVDVRKGSPAYGRHVAVELSAENWRQLYVPVGFAHGFCTLCEDTEVLYKVTAPYAREDEGGLLWNDPALAIVWPVSADKAILSSRDREWPAWSDFQSPFYAES